MGITVTFTPQMADLRKIGYLGIRSRPAIFWCGVGFFIVLPVISAVVASIIGYGSPRMNWTLVIVMLAVPVLSTISFYNLPVKLFGKSPALQGEQTYCFADEDIHAKSIAFDTRISWTIITSCFAHSFGVVFFSGKAPLLSIPGRALDVQGRNALLDLVARKGIKIEGNA